MKKLIAIVALLPFPIGLMMLTFNPVNSLKYDVVDSIKINLSNLEKSKEEIFHLKCKLDEIMYRDQKFRLIWDSIYRASSEHEVPDYIFDSTRKNDSENIVDVLQIINKYGWVPNYIIGDKAQSVLFFVIQHSDIKTQISLLPLVTHAVERKETHKHYFAYLFDRIMSKKMSYQLYGTQYYTDTDGHPVLHKILFPKLINNIRHSVELPDLPERY